MWKPIDHQDLPSHEYSPVDIAVAPESKYCLKSIGRISTCFKCLESYNQECTYGRYMQANGVDDDHPFGILDDLITLFALHNEM